MREERGRERGCEGRRGAVRGQSGRERGCEGAEWEGEGL